MNEVSFVRSTLLGAAIIAALALSWVGLAYVALWLGVPSDIAPLSPMLLVIGVLICFFFGQMATDIWQDISSTKRYTAAERARERERQNAEQL